MTRHRLTAASAATGALAFVTIAAVTRATPLTVAQLAVLGATIGAVVPVDLREHRIPNRLVLPAVVVSAPLAQLAGARSSTMLAGLALVALMLLISLIQPAAIGMGDVKLALLLAVGLGAHAPDAILASIVLAALYGLALLVRHGAHAGHATIPLAPFFACGALLVLIA